MPRGVIEIQLYVDWEEAQFHCRMTRCRWSSWLGSQLFLQLYFPSSPRLRPQPSVTIPNVSWSRSSYGRDRLLKRTDRWSTIYWWRQITHRSEISIYFPGWQSEGGSEVLRWLHLLEEQLEHVEWFRSKPGWKDFRVRRGWANIE